MTRPRGTFGTGAVAVKLKGGKARGVRRYAAALAGGSAPRAACKSLGELLAKPLQDGGVAAGDLRAVGAAVGARLCGKALPGGAAAVLAKLGLGAAPPSGGLNPGGGQTPVPSGALNQCSNGIDDDGGDQLADAREATGAADPDPGCSGPADTTENSEVALPAGCVVELSVFNSDDLFPASPCTAAAAGATVPATTEEVLLAVHTATLSPCAPVTSAITLDNGTVAKVATTGADATCAVGSVDGAGSRPGRARRGARGVLRAR